jgi:DNA-binding SARP family transcriptional activator/tetratricopeptide (TPR) repeat protein
MSRGLRFAILGPLEVHGPDGPLAVSPGKQRAILALLLLNAGEVVSRDRLVDALWGEAPPPNAVKALQVHIAQLRRALAGALGDEAARSLLQTQSPGYVIHVDNDDFDLTRFEAGVDASRRALDAGDARQAHTHATQALALWRGPPFAELEVDGSLHDEVPRIEALRASAQELAAEAAIALGRTDEALPELEALVREYPLRERLRGQLMLCLYRAGRQAEALEAYQATRRALVDELGIEPGRQLRELHEAILRQDTQLDPVAPEAPAPDAARSAFVGREREFAELAAGLDDAVAGRGRLFLVAGEPGIGKSRLAEELSAHARARGARVLVGRCWEAGGAPAYWPWVQALRGYVRESDPGAIRSQLGASAGDLAQIIPELREHFPDLPDPPSPESEGARFRLFDAATAFLRNASERRPILLILDDLHAADAPSLLLLQFLARELASSRVLALAAYRDVDPIPGPELNALVAELAREPITRRLALSGLSESELAEFVELTQMQIASAELVAALHGEAEGNPLFAGEIVRLLSVEGQQADATGSIRLAIPDTVRDVIARRLSHLSPECNRLLVLASVVGREFSLDILAALGGVSEEQVLDQLDEAMAARVVADVPGAHGALRFAHVLIRDTLYERLTAARRVLLHRLAVEALENVYGDQPGPHLAELAHHAMAGSQFDKGLRYAWRAGDRAVELLAYEEAARLYETALEALDLAGLDDQSVRCELLLSLGEAQARAGNSLVAKETFLAAADVARRHGLARELARAAAGYGGRTTWVRAGGDDRLVPLLEDGLAAVGDEVELRATLLGRLAGALRGDLSRERRDELTRQAVELARRTDNPAALAHALEGRAYAILAPDTIAETLALGTELRDVAARSGDRERVVGGHMLRIMGQLQHGDIPGAQADLDAASRVATELRQPDRLWEVWAAQAMLALAAGRLGDAEELVEQAFAHGERAMPSAAIPVHRLQRYTLCEFRGGLEELEPAIRDLVAEHPSRPMFRCVLAHLYARIGRTADARHILTDLARDDFSAIPFEQEWLYGMTVLAETAALLADGDCAPALYRLLHPFEGCNAIDLPEGMRGSVSRYLGLLAWTMSRRDEAAAHFEDALAMNARMRLRPWLAHTRADYAQMLLTGDAREDREHAEKLGSAARASYRELDMTPYESALVPEQRTPGQGRRVRNFRR